MEERTGERAGERVVDRARERDFERGGERAGDCAGWGSLDGAVSLKMALRRMIYCLGVEFTSVLYITTTNDILTSFEFCSGGPESNASCPAEVVAAAS